MTSELHGVKLHQHRRNVSVPRHKRRSSLQLCVLYFTLNQPSVRWHMREREHAHSATHVSSCLLIIPLYFHCIFILWLSLRTISAITSRGEKLSQGGGSTVAPRLPERGERREGREGGKEGGNRDVYSELNHWSLRHTAQEISSALIFHFDSEKNRSWLSKTSGRWNMWADKDSHCGSSYLILLNWVIQTVCYMQIPFMIMQHVKHKASALITSTHPPTTALPLPTSLPAQRGAGGWVGEGGYLL